MKVRQTGTPVVGLAVRLLNVPGSSVGVLRVRFFDEPFVAGTV
jgi:hypothetical protein